MWNVCFSSISFTYPDIFAPPMSKIEYSIFAATDALMSQIPSLRSWDAKEFFKFQQHRIHGIVIPCITCITSIRNSTTTTSAQFALHGECMQRLLGHRYSFACNNLNVIHRMPPNRWIRAKHPLADLRIREHTTNIRVVFTHRLDQRIQV
jgi:hypothetical protein